LEILPPRKCLLVVGKMGSPIFEFKMHRKIFKIIPAHLLKLIVLTQIIKYFSKLGLLQRGTPSLAWLKVLSTFAHAILTVFI